jgi:phosphoglycolate phosphatase
MQPKLILFDLDGVIIDSRQNMKIAWAAVQRDFPEAPAFEDYFGQIGIPFADIMRRLRLSEQAGTIEYLYRKASLAHMSECAFFDDIPDVLSRLARTRRLGIVTSKDRERTEAVLAKLPVEFACVETPNGVAAGKPAPDHLFRAMDRANMTPADTIYVGDMKVDAEAARRAGCAYAQAAWGYGEVEADLVLRKPEEMLRWV